MTYSNLESGRHIDVKWDAIPVIEENGYMLGYKVQYQLVKHSGMEVRFDNPVQEIVVDKFTFSCHLKDLKPYSEYRISVFGYAAEGDGPKEIFQSSN